jgi:hypothetical protein
MANNAHHWTEEKFMNAIKSSIWMPQKWRKTGQYDNLKGAFSNMAANYICSLLNESTEYKFYTPSIEIGGVDILGGPNKYIEIQADTHPEHNTVNVFSRKRASVLKIAGEYGDKGITLHIAPSTGEIMWLGHLDLMLLAVKCRQEIDQRNNDGSVVYKVPKDKFNKGIDSLIDHLKQIE